MKKDESRKFLALFLLMIAGLTIISQLLYSSYISLFNEGMITDFQMSLFADVTLAIVISITVIVGVRYVLHIRSRRKIKV